jgi:hypothetical protein
VFWRNTQKQSTWGILPVNSLLIVGTKSAQGLNTKIRVHSLGIKVTGFTQQFTQVFQLSVNSILALGRYLNELSLLSTTPTTSKTSLDKISIIKTTSCGRMV